MKKFTRVRATSREFTRVRATSIEFVFPNIRLVVISLHFHFPNRETSKRITKPRKIPPSFLFTAFQSLLLSTYSKQLSRRFGAPLQQE